MKNISYRFTIEQISEFLVSAQQMEDGWWNADFEFEYLTTDFPKMIEGQSDATLPGIIVRIRSIIFNKTETPKGRSILVRNGKISDTLNRIASNQITLPFDED